VLFDGVTIGFSVILLQRIDWIIDGFGLSDHALETKLTQFEYAFIVGK
jgi:hypothetical protein